MFLPQKKAKIKGLEEIFGGDIETHGLDCDDGFKNAYLSPISPSCIY